jgi:hypothetical protein
MNTTPAHEWSDKTEEVIEEILGNFEVTDEPQHYQSYPCHITRFQEGCITEKLREALSDALTTHSAHLVERIERDMEKSETGSHHYTDFEYGMLRAIDIVGKTNGM